MSDEQNFNELLAANQDAPVWAYLRVSSQKQSDDGGGLDTQRQGVQSYADAHGLGPVVFIEETASAGKPLIQARLPGQPREEAEINPRPKFMALIGHLAVPSPIKRHLIVYRLDRFARISSEQDMLLELLNRAGVSVHSTQAGEQSVLGGTDMRDPTRIVIRQVFAAFAQYERALIQMRLQAGFRAKAGRGGWVSGRPPFGYDISNKDLVINEAEAHIVRVIFFLRQQDLSLSQIASALHAEWNYPGMYATKVNRVLHSEALYKGSYTDPYGVVHDRPDYRILPEDWHTWAESNTPARTRPPLEFTP